MAFCNSKERIRVHIALLSCAYMVIFWFATPICVLGLSCTLFVIMIRTSRRLLRLLWRVVAKVHRDVAQLQDCMETCWYYDGLVVIIVDECLNEMISILLVLSDVVSKTRKSGGGIIFGLAFYLSVTGRLRQVFITKVTSMRSQKLAYKLWSIVR